MERSVVGGNVEISVVSGNAFTLGKDSIIYENTICHVHSNWLIDYNVAIASNCQIFSREPGCHGGLKVGANTRVGDFCIIDLSANVEIGKNVAIGPRTTIYTHDHDYSQSELVAPWKGDPVTKSVIIEDGCWIGSNVTILPGVTIGKNSIVATGAVVTKPVPAATLWAGVPAKQLKEFDQPANNGA
ncbi:DapH/DapD/GlmU-related protein [Flavihumibacter sp. ZG627]|uniref:acyltransferase n=1 Tax=Flavihumibacter sp. ZG627 TaxID=1463156 RepID=UPI00155AAD46|nr:acyltransferase [Flavihumibacter sp. ZG627]